VRHESHVIKWLDPLLKAQNIQAYSVSASEASETGPVYYNNQPRYTASAQYADAHTSARLTRGAPAAIRIPRSNSFTPLCIVCNVQGALYYTICPEAAVYARALPASHTIYSSQATLPDASCPRSVPAAVLHGCRTCVRTALRPLQRSVNASMCRWWRHDVGVRRWWRQKRRRDKYWAETRPRRER
jgi:hypothetical protein